MPTYFLTQFKSVQEVREAVQDIKVVFSLWNVRGFQLPIEFHYTFHDASGDSIVLEYIEGEPKIYENELGVMTNSPDFEWQRVNLNNYVNLTTEDAPARQIADVTLLATGTGSGMLGLPGDYTPPSRFVRTVALTQTAIPAKTHAEGLMSAFRISNAISFPEGPARQIIGDQILVGKTDFQLVADTANRVLYFRDYDYGPSTSPRAVRLLTSCKSIQKSWMPVWTKPWCNVIWKTGMLSVYSRTVMPDQMPSTYSSTNAQVGFLN